MSEQDRQSSGTIIETSACEAARRPCYRCVYGGRLPARPWRELIGACQSLLVCVNHVATVGELREVRDFGTCRNFRPRRKRPVRIAPPQPPSDDVRYIALTRGKFAIVDAADYERLNRYRWNAFESGGKIYARRSVPGGTVLMHREIMNAPPGMVVDHIDGNGLNNRRNNLRLCTPQQNEHNKPPRGGRSRYKGVYPHGDKWEARIKHNGRTHHLGLFDDETEAARARDRKARELQGPFAYLNFPEDARRPVDE
jgi:hypothetical protein